MTPLFSTAYFPPIAYVAALSRYREVLIDAKETFPKQTYRNRMDIVTAGGVRVLTVPVKRNNHSRTEEVEIDYKERWNVNHLRTLTAAYAASPYFLYYRDDIERLLLCRYDKLVELNHAALKWVLGKLKTECRMRYTDDYVRSFEGVDYRNTFSPKRQCQIESKPYYQVFADRMPFVQNMSILDVLMNLGPEAKEYISTIEI